MKLKSEVSTQERDWSRQGEQGYVNLQIENTRSTIEQDHTIILLYVEIVYLKHGWSLT